MKFIDYFNKNHNLFLDILIDQQRISPQKYKRENNIQIGEGFEESLEQIPHIKHHTKVDKPSKNKRDLVYFDTSLPLFPEEEDIEVKTIFSNFEDKYKRGEEKGKWKLINVRWVKNQGDSKFNANTLPHHLLIYQKYKNLTPAGIALVSRSRLLKILEENRYLDTRGDFILKVSLNDFDEGWYVKTQILPMPEDFYREIQAIDEKYRRASIQEKRICCEKHKPINTPVA